MYEAGGLKINTWINPPKTVEFSYGSDGTFATLKSTGLICLQDKLPKKTSMDFAKMLFDCISNIVGSHDFKKGDFRVMIDGEPIFIIEQKSMTISCMEDMSMFDQWAFSHLEKMWKER